MKKIIHDDHHLRSVIKAITYRITGTITTIIISYIITREIKWAISIGFVDVFAKIVIYYIHERIWNKVKLGKKTSEIEYTI